MNIRPKNTILFALTGVKFSLNNLRGANWRQQVFNNYRLHLLDLLAKYGEARDYGDWLNEMLSRHANIYNLAGGENGNWENVAYRNDLVGQYQQDYRGGLGNDGLYKRFGTTQINPDDKYDFNQTGIKTNQNTRYNIANPPSRTSGDYSRKGYNYKVDNLYSAITDDRRLLGRRGDWGDETSEEFKQWQKELNARGWETYLDKKEDGGDDYYKLRRLAAEPDKPPTPQELEQEKQREKINEILGKEKVDKESLWSKLGAGLKNVAPDLLDSLRLAGNMINNQRVYDESMKAILPNLQQSYHTYRQVVGDEATKLGYYRRAVQGEQRAARPFTSDADRQVAYMNEAKRIGDELRAQGDLADNQRIRETSAESSAHLDSNIERDTTVANSNLTEMLKADAAKHQLTALKHAADWTNLEQYLMGRLYKLEREKARQKELEELLATLDVQEGLLGDTTLLDLKLKREKAYNEYIAAKTPEDLERLKKIFDEVNTTYLRHYILKLRDALHRKYQIGIAKEGTKIEKKRKDDSLKYLYKTSRDIVEHFRKMSKMTDDSRVKTMPKPIKLPSHPKKFLYGGLAPFTIYRPLGVGGEEAYKQSVESGSSSSSKSAKDDAAKNKLDMIKELFKQVLGLPIDVSKVYQEISGVLNKAKAFGEELSTDDLASMYLNVMNRMSLLKYSLESFEKAKALATSNEALNEIAVGVHGEMVLQDLETGKVKIGTIADWQKSNKKLNPLTNDLILELRAKSPNMVFNDDILGIVNNGVGINKVSAQIKSLAATIGSSTEKLEGISQVESNKIKAGIQILAGTTGTPNGYYKVSTDLKSSAENVKAALNYIYSMLPNNYRTLLEIHSDGKGKELIANFLNSLVSDYVKQDISPLTGKASGKDKEEDLNKLSSNPLLAMLREIGGNPINYSIVTRDSNTKMSVNGTAYPALPGIKDDMSVDSMLSTSGLDQIVLSKLGITFGDQQLNPENLKDVMYANSGRNAIVTLPCKIVNGVKQVNLAVRDEYEKAELKAANLATRGTNEYLRILGQELKNAHLDSLLDSNGLPDKNMFSEFLIVEAYTTDKINLNNKNSQYIEKVKNPSEDLENRINLALSTDNKKSNYKIDVKDKLSLFELTYNDVYRGTVFIPINNNPAAAMLNDNIKINQQQDLEELYLISNKSNKYVKDNSF